MRRHTNPISAAAAALVVLVVVAPELRAEPGSDLVEELRPIIETGLASDDVAVRSWALRAAALTGDDAFEDAIEGEVENANAPVRIAAAQALLEMGTGEDDAEEVLVAEIVNGDAASRSLVLENILLHVDPSLRRSVIRTALREAADETLTATLVRHLAQRAEGDLYDLLLRVSDIDAAAQREVYTDAVIRAGRPIGVRIAEELLDSRDAVRRLEGAEIAFALNTVEARQLLEPLLDSSDAALAQRVGFHLARYGNAAALARAAELAKNPDMPVDLRMDAMALLRDNGAQLVSWSDVQAIIAEEGRTPEFVTRTYELGGATMDPEALSTIRGLLNGLFADERLLGIAAYGYSGQLDGVATFQEILGGSGDLALRVRAAEALGHLGGDAAAEALVSALRAERVDEVKAAIVSSLGHTGSAVAPQAIANTFALQNEPIAMAALDALLELGDASVASQVEMAATTFRSRDVRWRATVVLTFLDPELGRIRLLQALDRPPAGFRDEIAGLPADILDAVDERLLQHSDASVREPALFRVTTAPDGGYSVLQPLTLQASAPDVRRQAIAVVTATGSPDDADIFRALTEETDRSIRLQGFAALARLGDAANEEFFRGYLTHADVALRLIATYSLLAMAG